MKNFNRRNSHGHHVAQQSAANCRNTDTHTLARIMKKEKKEEKKAQLEQSLTTINLTRSYTRAHTRQNYRPHGTVVQLGEIHID